MTDNAYTLATYANFQVKVTCIEDSTKSKSSSILKASVLKPLKTTSVATKPVPKDEKLKKVSVPEDEKLKKVSLFTIEELQKQVSQQGLSSEDKFKVNMKETSMFNLSLNHFMYNTQY